MSNFKKGDIVVATNIEEVCYLTLGKEYHVQEVDDEFVFILCDANSVSWYNCCRFKLKEETVVNEVDTKQYLELSTGLVYDLVFEGDRVNVLKAVLSGSEVVVNIDNLKAPHQFVPYTKQMQKQQKKNDDLYVLASVTDEIRKLLDDNHVMCHAKVNRETKGLVEFNIMMGEVV